MKFQKPQQYKSNPKQPKCVRYWDKAFLNTDLWIHWVIFKEIAESHLPSIQKEFDCNLRTAREILWNDFIEATCGDEESPLWDESGDLLRALNERELAEYMLHLSIGTSIHDGKTEAEGAEEYIEWLREKPTKHGIYGEYRVTTDLEIIPVNHSSKKQQWLR